VPRFDPEALLRTLAAEDVRFVLIGGLAATLHGSPPRTGDAGICPEQTAENLDRLVRALRAMDARIRTVDAPGGLAFACDAAFFRRVDLVNLATKFGDLDVAFVPSGTTGYADLARGVVEYDLGGLVVPVADLADVSDRRRLPAAIAIERRCPRCGRCSIAAAVDRDDASSGRRPIARSSVDPPHPQRLEIAPRPVTLGGAAAMPRSLDTYRRKRDPKRTPEPFEVLARTPERDAGAWRFVVQQHAARRNHWDFRLEIDGVLASWAVPKGPSADPAEKRLAVETEDHPLDYGDFEGIIPPGNYGAGGVILWDRGVYRSVDGRTPAEGLAAGKLDLELFGHKLRGRWALVRLAKSETGKDWLLLKKADPWAGGDDLVTVRPQSVVSGLTVEERAASVDRTEGLAARAREAGGHVRAWPERDLTPMLAETADEAFRDDGWIFELKYDGVRALLARLGDGRVQLRSRGGRDYRATFPEIALVGAHLPCASFVVDGEIIAVEPTGGGSFELLQRRLGLSEPLAVARAARAVPVVMYAFDLPWVAGVDLRSVPLAERKAILRTLLPPVGPVRWTDHVAGDGIGLLDAARAHAVEGIVAKRAGSPYRPGRRSADWRKIKLPRRASLVVVGHTPGKGGRTSLGALLVAWWVDDHLTYAGSVGSGLDERTIAALLARLRAAPADGPRFDAPGERPPARAVFAEPTIVVDVRYTDVTSRGLLRHPVFLGVRDDTQPAACRAPAEAAPRAPEVDEPAAAPCGPAPPFAPSHREKVFWPRDGFTKGDLLDYYAAVWPWIGPHLRDRPVMLVRHPDGIDGKSFHQKRVPEFVPDWVDTCRIDDDEYFLCNGIDSLLYVVELGCIPLHVWSARRTSIERPDWAILDLDPKEAPFTDVVRIARHVHALLRDLPVPHYVKTSGQAGLHVLVPLGGKLTHDEARDFAAVLARIVVGDLPEIATVARPVAGRGGKVYVDYLQNGRGKTIAGPLSVRARDGAPVSMPLAWSQVTARLDPMRFTIRTAPALLRRGGDPMQGLLGEAADVPAALGALTRRLARDERRGTR
jgi:bifunctional non-homologous end joining protein LigD